MGGLAVFEKLLAFVDASDPARDNLCSEPLLIAIEEHPHAKDFVDPINHLQELSKLPVDGLEVFVPFTLDPTSYMCLDLSYPLQS